MEQELILSNHVFHITEDVIRDNIQVFPEKDWEKLIDFKYSKFYDFGQKNIIVTYPYEENERSMLSYF